MPASHRLANIDKLSQSLLRSQMELFSFSEARDILESGGGDVEELTRSEWTASFAEDRQEESLLEVAIRQMIRNRNVKRIRSQMIGASQYVQLLFPYLDSAVIEAYATVPIKLLYFQRAHCRAGFYWIPDFGDFKACSYPLSLKHEARFPRLLYAMRFSAAQLRTIRRMPVVRSRKQWSDYELGLWSEIRDIGVFNVRVLRSIFDECRLSLRALHALHTLHRFHRDYVAGASNLIVPPYA